jgi:hypothetical protein
MGKCKDRVSKGVALLDKHMPGWDKAINLTTLNVNSLHSCPLGQLYGNYCVGKIELQLMGHNVAYRHGFDVNGERTYSACEEYMVKLTKRWRKVISKRRTKEVPDATK